MMFIKNKLSTHSVVSILLVSIMTCALQCSEELIQSEVTDPMEVESTDAQDLISASAQGNLEEVQRLIEKGVDPNSALAYLDGDDSVKGNWNALAIASKYGKTNIVQYLLSRPNIQLNTLSGPDDIAPLGYAADNSNQEIVNLLIRAGAAVDYPQDYTPLMLLAASPLISDQYEETINTLINAGANIQLTQNISNPVPLLTAYCSNGSKNILKILQVSSSLKDIKTEANETPLLCTSLHGDFDVVSKLLNENVDPNISDNNGDTPLALASEEGHVDIVELLLARGANPHTRNNEGNTPLALASEEGHVDIVDLLLSKKANFTTRNSDGNTPLALASANGHLPVVDLLLARGANPHTYNNDNVTPFLQAIYDNHYDTATRLISDKTDLEVRDNDGDTPLIEATKHKNIQLVGDLLKLGASADVANNKGETALMIAANKEYEEIVKLMLSRGTPLPTNEQMPKLTDAAKEIITNNRQLYGRNVQETKKLLLDDHNIPTDLKGVIDKMLGRINMKKRKRRSQSKYQEPAKRTK